MPNHLTFYTQKTRSIPAEYFVVVFSTHVNNTTDSARNGTNQSPASITAQPRAEIGQTSAIIKLRSVFAGECNMPHILCNSEIWIFNIVGDDLV